MGDLSGKGSQTIHQYPVSWKVLIKPSWRGLWWVWVLILLFAKPGNHHSPAHLQQAGRALSPPNLLPGAWPGMAESGQGSRSCTKLRSHISSFLIRTWNNRWGKFGTKGYYVLAFISVHWLSLCCFMCVMKGQIKTHFSFVSILFLFFNYLSLHCIAATDGTLKMNSLFRNCILCSLFFPSKMTM